MPTPDRNYIQFLRTVPTSYKYPDAGIRWEPPTLAFPEELGYTVPTNAKLLKLSFLHRTGFQYVIQTQPLLAELNFPLLITATNGVQCADCPLLTAVTFVQFLPTNGSTISFNGGALTAASVNTILARAVANPAYVSGTINLAGGTNAAPTGQGVIDKATLQGRGVTVLTN